MQASEPNRAIICSASIAPAGSRARAGQKACATRGMSSLVIVDFRHRSTAEREF
jgi:hypothetical protein